MKFSEPLIEGRFLRRYKRFFVDVELGTGDVVVAHCANPGSMRTCVEEGGRVWLSPSNNPARKLKFTWELAEVDGTTVCVNTARANSVVGEALAAQKLGPLRGYESTRPEVKYGEKSRVDFLLEGVKGRCYVEVKSVTMAGGARIAAFPDSVTERGTRHLRELVQVRKSGDRAVMLFLCGRAGTAKIRPADEIDPVYGAALRSAATAGVELLAYGCELSPLGIEVSGKLPIDLSVIDV